jgi:hypothetical protein
MDAMSICCGLRRLRGKGPFGGVVLGSLVGISWLIDMNVVVQRGEVL